MPRHRSVIFGDLSAIGMNADRSKYCCLGLCLNEASVDISCSAKDDGEVSAGSSPREPSPRFCVCVLRTESI